jgi:nicotinamidase-related amidase
MAGMNGPIAVLIIARKENMMGTPVAEPDLSRSALLIVAMQNDFVHPEGHFGYCAQPAPEAGINLQFLMSTICQINRLSTAFRKTDVQWCISHTW